MTKPNNFILNTDFPTIRNSLSNNGTVSITIPKRVTIAPGGYWQATANITIGAKASIIRSTITTSFENKTFVARNLTETDSSPSGTYYKLIDLYRINPTTMQLSVFIPNTLYPLKELITANEENVITCNISTFLSPFN